MITTAYRQLLWPAIIWAVLCLMAQEATGSKNYFSSEMTKSWNDVYTPIKAGLSGGAVFLKIHENQKSHVQEQMQLLVASETLKVYNTILTKLLEKTQDQAAKNNLNYLKSKIEELRTKYFGASEKQLELITRDLKELQAINTNDEIVQRKAIKEMKVIYNWASFLGELCQSTLRRRRQTRRQSVRPKP